MYPPRSYTSTLLISSSIMDLLSDNDRNPRKIRTHKYSWGSGQFKNRLHNLGFKQHLKEAFYHLKYRKTLIVQYHGRPKAVLLDYEEYRRLIRQRQMLLQGIVGLHNPEIEPAE